MVKSSSKNPEFSFKHHVRHLTTIWFCLNEMIHPLLSPVGICVVVTCTYSYTQIIQLKKTILVAFNYSSTKMLNYVVCILFKNYNSLIKGIESLLLSMSHEQWEHKKWVCVCVSVSGDFQRSLKWPGKNLIVYIKLNNFKILFSDFSNNMVSFNLVCFHFVTYWSV